ncbi:F510_1955 family glycosylhydrolase [Streptomyces sp. MUM 2J]|uniref:F510_1955 family glycosylhydrolase n=1 Tax=Streptomyces sp. MUM 2J TaxID=2791987 RepID=UPI001F03E895|nr:exo-alpha-sialidase [Streptomyces sp. MUM 2J]MCH0561708.1 exo-alpha-sialidase [Streptomyces sp. MUM 2J]
MPLHRRPAATVSVLLAATLAACTGSSEAPASTESSASTAAVSHIHGLGLDPADNRLYVATHEGVVQVLDDGSARRVSDTADYMAFTVAGAHTFLGSGHPADDGAGHADRGLLRSTDAGRTWKTVSLGGEADFHALEYAHGTVYGYDSTHGLLRVSGDGLEWDDRAELAALDIAVSPDDPDLVLATTERGVARSTDGGRTFAQGARPVLAFVSWAASDAVYGIGLDGGLYLSTDAGSNWKQAGTVPGGRPQALTAVDAEHVLAATQDGVYASRDGGTTFTERLPVASAPGH